jgi:hypothetical protein
MMTRLCLTCDKEERFHPEVGMGYRPHDFAPAERRQAIRRMEDREKLLDEIVKRHSRSTDEQAADDEPSDDKEDAA